MPLYEYECKQCQRRLEKIQKFSDAQLTVCPHCGGTLERTITAPAIQFKGAGWYKDLYSSAKPAAAAPNGESAAAPAGAETPATAAAKPDSTAPAVPASSSAPASSPAPSGS